MAGPTPTTRDRLQKQFTGENINTWGLELNSNFDLIDVALDGRTSFALSGTKTLTSVDYATDESRARFLDITSGVGGTVTIPAVEKVYLVRNNATGDVIITTGGATTATVKSGNVAWVACDADKVHLGVTTDYGSALLKSTGTPSSGSHLTNKTYVDAACAAVVAAATAAASAFVGDAEDAADASAASAASASGSADTATAQAAIATDAAAAAVGAASTAAGFSGTSATSFDLASSLPISKAFTTQANKQFGSMLFATGYSAANSANRWWGTVTSYSGTTLTVSVLVAEGSGSPADWVISVSGARGATGATGADGADGAPDTVTAADFDMMYFGDGFDGNVTVSGAVTLTRDMYYNNLTLSTGADLNPAGFRIFVKGTLDLTAAPVAAISRSGTAGTAATSTSSGGTNGTARTSGSNPTLGVGLDGQTGASGNTGAGSDGGVPNASNGVIGAVATSGAAGASGTGNAGGAAGGTTAVTYPSNRPNLSTIFSDQRGASLALLSNTARAGRGATGAGDGTNRGGASGGSGASGGPIFIAARTIARGAGSAAAAIQSKAGATGAGFAPGAGNAGGAGGTAGSSGGWIVMIYRTLTGSAKAGLIDASGANGANGTNGIGSGSGGNGGGSGGTGRVDLFDLGAGTWTVSAFANGTAGTAASGINGGAGATATPVQVTL